MSDAIFTTDLASRSLIEASAGTGKTYVLAGLFARAVIVDRRRVPEVLAVTYTVAATQELHERVRLRLQQAAELAVHWREGDPETHDDDTPERALLRRMVHLALDDNSESIATLRQRLVRAVRDMDLAAITTIHGFCQRVLAEHAFDTRQPLLAAQLEPDNAAHRHQLAVDLWREFSVDADGATFLQRHFAQPAGLAEALRDLLAPDPLLPVAPITNDASARPKLEAAWRDLAEAFFAHGAQARADVLAAIDDKVLNSAQYKPEHIASLWNWLSACAASGSPAQCHEKLAKFIPAILAKATLAKRAGRTPRSPLFDAVAIFIEAFERLSPLLEAEDVGRLHALRDAAFRRDRIRKQTFNVHAFDDLIGAVFDAVHDPDAGPLLAQALRAQFPLVLVDEFQDTDARQWAIFAALFAAHHERQGNGLVLVGDPKQAIYRFRGGDVQTYLTARATAHATTTLGENHRSRPCLLTAVNAMFAGMSEDAFGADIAYAPATPGGKTADRDYLLDGTPAPALRFHVVPPDEAGKDWNKAPSIAHASILCARAIRDCLALADAGRAQRRDKQGLRALHPRDCAVLVRTHPEALAVRAALAALGVPAVSAGRRSLFESEQAQELLTLLVALAAPGDERRLRAALSTRLLGGDAASLQALDSDGDTLRHWQQVFAQWRLRWEQHGPQAMLADVVAQHAARLLAQSDGERQLTHLLQMGELMQESRAQRLGTQGQIDSLRAAIADADKDDEQQWPRLESDAGRVQIMTLHASKGLEFPLVFLPFAGIGRRNGNGKHCVSYHDASGQRVRQWKTSYVHGDEPVWKDACAAAECEERDEDMRLLYVGLTRARDALWLCGGALANSANSALHRLVGGAAPSSVLQETLTTQLQLASGLPDLDDNARLSAQAALAVPVARVPQRHLRRDWWIHSFSQLHRQKPHGAMALIEETPADDERALAASALANSMFAASTLAQDRRFGGTRFGNALHHALEHVDFAAWRDCDGLRVPDGQTEVLLDALQALDYPQADHADGVRELAPLVARTLNTALPAAHGDTVRLCDVPVAARVAELEFHFTLFDADSAALLALLHRHAIASGRRDFGAWPRLSGLMNGKIDLTYLVDGRAYVLDYKSNRLTDYDAATLVQAMTASEYDLQALLYVVALHRWQRLRRGSSYDYARDFGGVRYVFCRGLDPREPQRGVIAPQFDAALVEAMDALLAPDGGRA